MASPRETAWIDRLWLEVADAVETLGRQLRADVKAGRDPRTRLRWAASRLRQMTRVLDASATAELLHGAPTPSRVVPSALDQAEARRLLRRYG